MSKPPHTLPAVFPEGTRSVLDVLQLKTPQIFGERGGCEVCGRFGAAVGLLFVSDFFSNNIYEFTPGGARSTFASGLNQPLGLAFDSAGNLFEGLTFISLGHMEPWVLALRNLTQKRNKKRVDFALAKP